MKILQIILVPILSISLIACDVSDKDGQEVGPTSSGPSICKVLDPDTSESYKGECKDGLAHGHGESRGGDLYVGSFSEGVQDGSGTYTWGPTSEWAGDVYTGEWVNGNRTGQGLYRSPTNIELEGSFINGQLHGFAEWRIPRMETVGITLSEDGFWRDDTFILRGFWREHKFVLACENEADCIKKWTALQKKKADEAASAEKKKAAEEKASEEKWKTTMAALQKKRKAEAERQQELLCHERKQSCYLDCEAGNPNTKELCKTLCRLESCP